MARLHIVLGYTTRDKDALPFLLHMGRDADKAVAVRDRELSGNEFLIIEHIQGARGYRKTNDNPIVARSPIATPLPSLIPVSLGEGEDDQEILIYVGSEEEAAILRQLEVGCRGLNDELLASRGLAQSREQEISTLRRDAEAFNQRLAQLEDENAKLSALVTRPPPPVPVVTDSAPVVADTPSPRSQPGKPESKK